LSDNVVSYLRQVGGFLGFLHQ